MLVTFLSDTHGLHNQVQIEPCDILIHAGDFTNLGEKDVHNSFVEWFEEQPAKHRILIGGNHDLHLSNFPNNIHTFNDHGITYLEDEMTVVDGIKIYGSPWTPRFGDWAFMMSRETIGYMWDKIPDDVDILVTHGPAYGILDQPWGGYEHVGCKSLLDKIMQVRPKIHLSGHIHGSYGEKLFNGIQFYNVSVCGEDYKVQNKPVTIEV